MSDLAKHFEATLKDVYYAERQIHKALPKMIRKAQNADLKGSFEQHRSETEEQIGRLEEVFQLLEIAARGKKCPAIDGILDEGAELMEEHEPGPGLDAALAAAAQAVEHYEIARYGTLCAWCETLGYEDAGTLLGQNLAQEEETDVKLFELAMKTLNRAAIGGAKSKTDADDKSEDDSDQDEDDSKRSKKGKMRQTKTDKAAKSASAKGDGQPQTRR